MSDESVSEISIALERIRQRLLDLTLRNRLLNYRPRAQTVTIVDELPDELFDRLVDRTLEMALRPCPDEPTEEPPVGLATMAEEPAAARHRDRFLQTAVSETRFPKVLRRLSGEARRAIDETGTNILYLAIGMLAWRDVADEKLHHAPLLLVPLELRKKRSSKGTEFRIAWTEEEIERNVSLAKMLSDRFGITLPTLPDDAPFSMETWLKEASTTIGNGTTGDWEVRREAVVDLFSFARLFMYLDLDPASWPESHSPLQHPIIERLLFGGDGDFSVKTDRYTPDLQDHVDEMPLTFDADSAQTTAILEATKGQSLVIEGPPGTGKSQTISNLIALFLHEGKSILFLSEKLAALEVVHQRLDRINLTPFLLELHSNRLHRPAFVASLKERVELKYRKPRGLESPLEQYRTTRRRLDDWAAAIGASADKTGTTIHDAFWKFESARMELEEAGFDFPILPDAEQWDLNDLTHRGEVAQAIGKTLEGRIPSKSPWHGFWPRRVSPADRDKVANMLSAIAKALESLSETTKAFTAVSTTIKSPTLMLASVLAAIPPSALLAIPTQDKNQLGKGLAKTLDRQDARVMLHNLELAQKLGAEVEEKLPKLRVQDESTLTHMEASLKLATDGGWSKLRLEDLQNVLERSIRLVEIIDELSNAHEATRALGMRVPLSKEDLKDLQTELEYWRRNTPPDLSLYLAPNLFQRATLVVFRQAEQDAARVRALRTEAEKIAWLDPRPDSDEIQQCIAAYVEYGESFTRFLFPRWRAAKRHALVLLRQPPEEPAEIISQLRQVATYLGEASALTGNERYASSLGLIFQGESTGWSDAERILNWALSAKEKSSSELIDQITTDLDATSQQIRNLHDQISRIQQRFSDCELKLDEASRGFRSAFLREIADDSRFQTIRTELMDKISELTPLVSCSKDRFGMVPCISDLRTMIKAERQARDAIASVMTAEKRCIELFGRSFAGGETNLPPIQHVVESLDGLLAAGMPEETIQWLAGDMEARRADTITRVESIRDAWTRVAGAAELFTTIARVDPLLLGGSEGTLDAAVDRVSGQLTKMDELIAWSGWSQLREEAIDLGMKPLIKFVENGQVPTDKTGVAFEWSRAGSLITNAFETHPILQSVTGDRRLVLAERFRELEQKLIQWNIHRVRKACAKRKVPNGISRGNVSSRTELALIRHEISKSRSYLPVRQLLLRAGTAMQALKPCFMMSPLAVARFLPHELEFDVLIVDEASQLRPEDCLGAIGRSKQIVVVGDPKQLPPTSFFNRLMGDADAGEDEETAFDNVESILDVVSANLAGSRRLLWHYRSRHQDLIRFSNSKFYDGTLTAFPTPRPRVAGRGVELRYLPNAVYANGANPAEALAVATEAAELILADLPGSIGIAAFNSRQRDLIEDALELLASQDATLMGKLDLRAAGDEPLFIKNLENVQGDERDVMLLSFTYGPEAESGKVYQRFGPINSVGGWRRLNVLFTRARERILVFSSMRPDQIRIDTDSSRGVRALREYLEFVAAPEIHTEKDLGPNKETLFSAAIGDVLRESGLQSDSNVGEVGCAIDVAVRDPDAIGAYSLGIESDGEEFYANPVARERERIRPEVLTRLGWNLHTIHAPDWFRDRETALSRLLAEAQPESDSQQ